MFRALPSKTFIPFLSAEAGERKNDTGAAAAAPLALNLRFWPPARLKAGLLRKKADLEGLASNLAGRNFVAGSGIPRCRDQAIFQFPSTWMISPGADRRGDPEFQNL